MDDDTAQEQERAGRSQPVGGCCRCNGFRTRIASGRSRRRWPVQQLTHAPTTHAHRRVPTKCSGIRSTCHHHHCPP
eukprot:1200924-Amphidinium_carterae.1